MSRLRSRLSRRFSKLSQARTSKHRSLAKRKALRLETLEARQLLAVDAIPFADLSVTSSGSYSAGSEIADAFNGTGLTGDLHSNLWTDGWLSKDTGVAEKWIKVDLGGTYVLDSLDIWNGNQLGNTAKGIQQADVFVATIDPGNNLDGSDLAFDATNWTSVLTNQPFTQASGVDGITSTDSISLGSVEANYLAIRVDSNHAGESAGTVSLAEMTIFGDEVVTLQDLTVVGGTGTGNYGSGSTVDIVAGDAPAGQQFFAWSGGTASDYGDVFAATTTFTMPAEDVTITATYVPVGTVVDQISPGGLTVTSSANFGGGEIVDAFNGVGLTGDLHSSLWTDGWLSADTGVADKWIKVDLGGTYLLSSLEVWNGNQVGGTDKGIQQADIFIATVDPDLNTQGTDVAFDATGWTPVLANQTFTQASGVDGIASTDQVILGGVEANFLAIRVDSNFGAASGTTSLAEMKIFGAEVITMQDLTVVGGTGTGNYGSGSTVDIVAGDAPAGQQFFAWSGGTASDYGDVFAATTTFTMPAEDVTITATYVPVGTVVDQILPGGLTVTSSANFGGGEIVDAFNGVGLTGDLHSSLWTDGWLSADTGVADKWIKVDLGGTYLLSSLEVWNGNQVGGTDKGIQQADIFIATVDPDLNTQGTDVAFDATGWTPVLTNQTFTQASGVDGIASTDQVILGGVEANFLAIRVDSNFGAASGTTSLAEMKIFGAEVITMQDLTVVGGTGTGNYGSGSTVDIVAGDAPAGQQFFAWSGGTANDYGDVFAATTTFTMPAEDVTITATYVPVGTVVDQISPGGLTVTSSANFGGGEIVDAFNGVGLTGDLHSSLWTDGWLSADTGVADKWIKVDLGGTYLLSSLEVWNGNQVGGTDKGIQQADIFIATVDPDLNTQGTDVAFDATGWTPVLANQTFTQASGVDGIASTDQVILGGVEANFLAIRVDSNFGAASGTTSLAEMKIFGAEVITMQDLTVVGGTGTGNYGSGSTVDIVAGDAPASQQFFAWSGGTASDYGDVFAATTTFTMPAEDVTITATYVPVGTVVDQISPGGLTVTSSANFGGGEIVDAFNGVGLTGDLHSSLWTDGWLSADTGVADKWIKVDLGGTYLLSSLEVWNGNQVGGTDKGIQQADIFIATVDPDLNTQGTDVAFDATGWTPVLANQTFTQASGVDGIASTDQVILGGVEANFLAIRVDSNFGAASGTTSLAEMKIFGAEVITMQDLTVVGGTGTGNYGSGSTVDIVAGDAPASQQFFAWSGGTASDYGDVFAATTTFTMPAEDVTITATYVPVGTVVDQILPGGLTVTSSANFGGGEIVDAFNGVGLTGDLHSSLWTDGWLSADTGVADKWIKVDLGGTYLLSSLEVWNGNQVGGTDKGIQQADIFIATVDPDLNTQGTDVAFDATGWTPVLTNQTFTQASGVDGIASTDQVILGGVEANFLAIRVDSNFGAASGTTSLAEMKIFGAEVITMQDLTVVGGTGTGNYGSGSTVDIVAGDAPAGQQFFAWSGGTASDYGDVFAATTTFTMPAEDVTITATYVPVGSLVEPIDPSNLTITSSGSYSAGSGIEDVFNGVGLTGDLHSNLWTDGWLSKDTGVADKWIKIDLGDTYLLSSIDLWNGNQGGNTAKGIQQADIFIAPSDPGSNTVDSDTPFDPSGWTPVISNQQLTQASGVDGIAATDHIILGGVETQYLAIRVDSNFGDPSGTIALAEMKINAVFSQYDLTVTGGSGTGTYREGGTVLLAADEAQPGQIFDAWIGDVSSVANIDSSTTSLVIPASAVNLTATYKAATPISHPANLTWGKTVTTSNAAGTNVGENAVDGNFQVYWQTAAGDADPWLKVDLGQVFENVDRINLGYFVGRVASHYTLEVSVDNVNWTTVADNPNGVQTERQDNLFDPVSARYVRYNVEEIAPGAVFVGLDEIQVFQSRPVQELVRRNETPNFISKLESGDPVTIAYVGGSITVGAALPNPGGYRLQSQALFAELYPDANITEIMSASGGKGTEKALEWIDQADNGDWPDDMAILNRADGLVPDMVFIEFAVNDSHGSYEIILDNMEEIVRQIRDSHPTTDIAFLYSTKAIDGVFGSTTYADTGTNYATPTDHNDIYTLNQHRYQVSAAAFEEVADHYGIPTIHMGKEYAEQAGRGEIIHQLDLGNGNFTPNPNDLPVFSPDGVHPNAGTGHRLYTEAIARAFNAMQGNTTTLTHTLPDPIRSVIATYDLSVTAGSGTGIYIAGAGIPITADDAPAGQVFAGWTGSDAANFADVNSPTTSFTMPAGDASITATYATETFVLTVGSGTGAGSYVEGTTVTIVAADAPDGEVFAVWTGDIDFITDVNSSATTFTMPSIDANITATYEPVASGNEIIPPSQLTVISSSQYGSAGIAGAFDGSGLTGDLHNDVYTQGWLSGPTGADGQWIIVDLGGDYSLDHLRAWNYNQPGWTQRGISQADIYVSTSGIGNNAHLSGAAFDSNGWNLLVSDQAFTQSPGGAAIENTDANIDLPSVSASQIAIVVDANFGGNFAGLAEMQIFAASGAAATSNLTVVGGIGSGVFEVGVDTPITADAAPSGEVFAQWTGDVSGIIDVFAASTTFTMQDTDSTITATYQPLSSAAVVIPSSELTVISSSQYSIAGVAGAFDGSGLSGEQHNDIYTDGWLSGATGATGQWIVVDLGGSYNLDHLRAWNFNQPGWTQRGISQADIYYSTSDTGNNSHLSGAAFDSTGWQTLVNDQAFTQSPGGSAIDNTDANIALPAVTARRIAIVVDSSFGGTFAGLAEMEIYVAGAAAATSSLTVTSGSGTGVFEVGTNTPIAADAAPAGEVFVQWTGDVSGVVDVFAASTTFTMQATDSTISATYVPVTVDSTVIPASELTVISSSQYSIAGVAGAFDGSGLSGEQHNDIYTDGWLSAATGATGQWIVVDLGGSYNLDHLRAWNFNQPGWTQRGISQADIYYSTSDTGNNSHLSGAAFDSTGWQTLVNDQAFTQSPGGSAIDNTDANIVLPAVTARRIAIVVDSSFGGTFAGLAELEIYVAGAAATASSLTVIGGSGTGVFEVGIGTPITADAAPSGEVFAEWTGDVSGVFDVFAASTTFTMQSMDSTLTATYAPMSGGSQVIPASQLTVTSSSQYSTADAAGAFDGSGLSGDLHNDIYTDGWLSSPAGAAGQWVIVDLGGTFTLDHLRAWNFNQPGWSERGIAQADLYYSSAGVGNNSHLSGAAFDSSGWQTLVNDQVFTRSPGGITIENTDANIDLLNVTATQIAIVVDSNFGGNFAGFAEMQIYGELEASSAASASFSGGSSSSSQLPIADSESSPVTEDDLLLLQAIPEESDTDSSLLPDSWSSDAVDNAFTQLGQQVQTEDELQEEEDELDLLLSSLID